MSKVSRAEYYEKAFDRLEKTGKHTWNWAAFFGGFSWMGYRKIYLFGMIFNVVYWILYYAFLMGAIFAFIKSMPIAWVGLVLFILLIIGKRICLGRFGNALYYWTVKKRIGRGYHLLEKYRPTSIVAIVFPLFVWIADIISHGVQFDKVPEDDVTAESIHAYLNPNKKNHWIIKTANVLVCMFWILTVILYVHLSEVVQMLENSTKLPGMYRPPVMKGIDYLYR